MLKNIYLLIERLLRSPVYFILYSAYPVLNMYANNASGVLLVDLFRPLIISVISAILLFSVLQKVIRHSQTSALLVFSIFFSFFNYVEGRNLLTRFNLLSRNETLAMARFFLTILLLIFIVRSGPRWDAKIVSEILNLMSIILLLFPCIHWLGYVGKRSMPLERKVDHTVKVNVKSNSPHIYYIILDAYTRSDVMKNDVGYDNGSFINSLQDMGFYVANCSQSNYGMTSLSLSSSLNMDYVQNISNVFQPDEGDLLYAFKLLDSNALRNTLTDAGYETDVFASGFNWIEWRDADHFISPKPEEGTTEFEGLILFSSYARILDDFGIINLDDVHAEHYRQRTRFVLTSFDDLLKLPSPKYVFIHIIAPHSPYGLDKNGHNLIPDQLDALHGYKNQAEFIGTAILPQLRKLMDGSVQPPIILLQGDHGRPGSKPEDMMTILNAYFLPGHMDQLYPSISPVNSFRIVLNSYFGTNLPLLEDVSYYSSDLGKYNFTVLPNTCP